MGYFLSSYLFVYTLTSIVKSRLLNASQFVLVKSKNLRTLQTHRIPEAWIIKNDGHKIWLQCPEYFSFSTILELSFVVIRVLESNNHCESYQLHKTAIFTGWWLNGSYARELFIGLGEQRDWPNSQRNVEIFHACRTSTYSENTTAHHLGRSSPSTKELDGQAV